MRYIKQREKWLLDATTVLKLFLPLFPKTTVQKTVSDAHDLHLPERHSTFSHYLLIGLQFFYFFLNLHSWEPVICHPPGDWHGSYPPALRRNDNWAWNVSVWRMPDKQSRSNYTRLLLQMKRIKANESYTGQHRGCLMKREWETAEGSVCVSRAC